MSIQTKNPMAGAIGAAFIASVAFAPLASAVASPFQITQLSSGYTLAEAGKTTEEGKHGEGDHGAAKADDSKAKEGKCGEGKCGEGKCGASGKAPAAKAEAGKSAEGKCGASK